MINNNLFTLGQAVGVYQFTSLPLSKLSLPKKAMVFDGKTIIAGRIIGTEERYTSKSVPENYLLIITINGIIISARKNDILIDSNEMINSFLKREEFFTLSSKKEPYNGKLVKKDDGNWYIQV